ncbi:MAG: restriction endonuclease [Pyrinomonadaceae bacterium]
MGDTHIFRQPRRYQRQTSKGADHGIDGVAYTRKSKDEVSPILILVKSGKNVGVCEVRDLFSVIEREAQICGILITRNSTSKR